MDNNKSCEHVNQIKEGVVASSKGCEDCLKMGPDEKWVALRVCLTCGHVGCCDSSKNTHATKHFHDTNHPIMQASGKNETWIWCYIDNQYVSDSGKKMYQEKND